MAQWQRFRYFPVKPLGEDGRPITGSPRHIALSKRAAGEGMILLKNEGKALPLLSGARVALFGKASVDYVKGGGGSGDVIVKYVRNLVEAMETKEAENRVSCFRPLHEFYRAEVLRQYASGAVPGFTTEPELSSELLDAAARFADVAVISICRYSLEESDRHGFADDGDFYLSVNEKTLVREVCARFPKVVVVLNVGGIVDTSWCKESPNIQAVLLAWQGGMEGATAEAEILFGDVNPSGKLSDTLASSFDDYPSSATFHESDDYVNYTEGVFVGYRYFETFADARKKVNYPFGFGLSYTDFEIGSDGAELCGEVETPAQACDEKITPAQACGETITAVGACGETETPTQACDEKITAADACGEEKKRFDKIRVRVSVKNTGAVPGKEVVQLYVSAPQIPTHSPEEIETHPAQESSLKENAASQIPAHSPEEIKTHPAFELKAFHKTKLLAPGETEHHEFIVSVSEFAHYNESAAAWIREAGNYDIFIGNSVESLTKVFTYECTNALLVQACRNRCLPENPLLGETEANGKAENLPENPLLNEKGVKSGREILPEGHNENPAVDTENWPENPRSTVEHILPDRYGEKNADGRFSFEEVATGKHTVDEFLDQLTDDELITLTGGTPNRGLANTKGLGGLDYLGIPAVMTADGPAGLRLHKDRGTTTTAWPVATLLSCTWNPELIEEIGRAGAREVKENNIGMWLTPAINIHRSPLCGRNFEYYSEDPYLTGKMAAAMVRGIQSENISACVKHFCVNNKETNRKASDSRVSTRALREIYLKAFEIVVKESDVWSVMTSYNKLNGVYTSENRELLQGILRDEWGYDGLIITDWVNLAEQYKEVLAGNNVRMPYGGPKRLQRALREGVITREDLRKNVRKLLEFFLKLE